jgi:dipeptidyl-peptidase-4
VVFLRTKAGDDPVTCLWVLDVPSGTEECRYDPREHGEGTAELTEAERVRRERMRERARGVTAYACDRDVTRAVFVDGGQLCLVDLGDGSVRTLPTAGVPDDPRLSPDGSAVAYVLDGALWVGLVDGEARQLVSDPDPDVHWGLADFIAAEELERGRGYWWSPDGTRIATARVDERPVLTWWISEPSDPAAAPRSVRYPQAGTPNAIVTLHVVQVATGERIEVAWDRVAFEYLARVSWGSDEPLTLQVISRDQRTSQILTAADDGATTVVHELRDDRWLDLIEGAPAWSDGRLISTVDADDTHRLRVGEHVVTPPGLQVGSVIDAADGTVWFHAIDDDPLGLHVYRVRPGDEPERVTTEPGLHTGDLGGPTLVRICRTEDLDLPSVRVARSDGSEIELGSVAEPSVVDARPTYAQLGPNGLRAALLLPGGREPDEPVPVLLSPYGFPHFRMVVRWRGMYRIQQWFADRLGAAVLSIDGRGTPGGVAWERAVDRDFSVVLEDQVEGLREAADRWPFLDLTRVAIRGWSGGGVLAGLAVLKRPDVFQAAIAGAPVGDQRLYDTAYSERYLGDPTVDPEPYERTSLVSNARTASPHRRLLLMHGFADDNVFVANTLQLSAALLESGYPHDLVLLPNSSHMGGMEALSVAQDLAELDFLRDAFALPMP